MDSYRALAGSARIGAVLGLVFDESLLHDMCISSEMVYMLLF